MAAASDGEDGRGRAQTQNEKRNQKGGRSTAGMQVITQTKGTRKGKGGIGRSCLHMPLDEARRGGIYTQSTVDTSTLRAKVSEKSKNES